MRIGMRWCGSVLAVWLRQPTVAVVLVCALWTMLPSPELARAAETLSAEACFTPGEDCTERLVRLLDGAQREILGACRSIHGDTVCTQQHAGS